MIISKCVPLEISRKRFSDFTKNYTAREMTFVGLKQDGDKKINVQLDYDRLLNDIAHDIKDKEWGNEIKFHEVLYKGGINWNPETQSHIIDLERILGAVEINCGGDYVEDTIYFMNPIIGTVTNVVIDNTGLPEDSQEDGFVKPVSNFDLYYGIGENRELIASVPPFNRGVVQILHTRSTDIVVHFSFSPDHPEYIVDEEVVYEDDDNPDPYNKTPNLNILPSYDIDLENEKCFIEFETDGNHKEYTFWFSNPEHGSSTYIVIDNTGENKLDDVTINYGKRMDVDDDSDDVCYPIITVTPQEKVVIEVFHSLSADIIVKTTKF